MTEISRYWNGLVTGDAVLAPYTAAVYQDVWDKLFVSASNQGNLEGFLNELIVTGVSGGVTVATGGAMVSGVFYESTEVENITIPIPETDPRIDRIVVRKTPSDQTARIIRVVGTEAASPTPPVITQISGGIWDIPLARVLITTTGVITVIDEREVGRTPLASIGNIEKIESIVSDGTLAVFNFDSVPQRFKHLQIEGFGRHSDPGPASGIVVFARFNGDNGANYNIQTLRGQDVNTVAGTLANQTELFIGEVASDAILTGIPGQFSTLISNYTSSLYKTVTSIATKISFLTLSSIDTTAYLVRHTAGIWKDTNPITQIQLVADPAFGLDTVPFIAGTEITLYGYD